MTRKVNDTDGGYEKTSRKPGGVGASYDAAFVGYINLQLTDDEKSAFPAWFESASFWPAFSNIVEAGVNISVKIEQKSGGFLASGTQRLNASPNAGLVVTARARDASTALGRLVFSLLVLSHYERWVDRQAVADPDRW